MRFDGPPLDDLAESSPHVFYEEVAMLLREREPQAGAAFLRGRAGSDQRPARLAGALFGLSWHGAADVEHRPLLLGQLGHPDELVVQEAIDGLASLGSSQDLDVVASHATHRSPYVRGAVLRYRQRVFDAAARPWLLAGLSDPDPVVRFWALDALDDLGPRRRRRAHRTDDSGQGSRHRRTRPSDRRPTSRVLTEIHAHPNAARAPARADCTPRARWRESGAVGGPLPIHPRRGAGGRRADSSYRAGVPG